MNDVGRADAPQCMLIETALGWMAAAATERGLRYVVLPRAKVAEAEAALLRACPGAERVEELPGDLVARLKRYALGEPVDFLDELDLEGTSPFLQRAWAATRAVPRGQTRSYQWLAQQAGSPRAARAAGRAMALNPVPIVIPCHRIVGSNGKLHGFGGGLDLKARMLGLEAAGA